MTERQCSTPAFIYPIASAELGKSAGRFRLVMSGRHGGLRDGKAIMMADNQGLAGRLGAFDWSRDCVIGQRHEPPV
ncbi:MAG: hypothetical protein ACON3Z_11895 [Bradymonadia bacterium]